MRKKIYVLTEDLSFFFRLNMELQQLKINFSVLSIRNKIPNIPNSIILSTLKEVKNFKNIKRIKGNFLTYAKEENFDQYIVKVLAVKKIGNKVHSELVFSIDPGTKHLGLVIFLDDYYLNSHTIFEIDSFIEKIKVYINALQETNPNPLKLIFKFGRGIMKITLKLIEQIFKNFNNEMLKVILIDESKTSKYRIRDENKKKIPKDEAAALMISLRYGAEITYNKYEKVRKQIDENKIKNNEFHDKVTENYEGFDLKLIEIAENVLNGNLSLSKSMELIKIEKKIN